MKFLGNKKQSHIKQNICLNCGSEVDGDVCKCCGTVCKNIGNIHIKFDDKAHFGELTVQGVNYQVYLGEVEMCSITDCNGNAVVKHKFTMIEV